MTFFQKILKISMALIYCYGGSQALNLKASASEPLIEEDTNYSQPLVTSLSEHTLKKLSITTQTGLRNSMSFFDEAGKIDILYKDVRLVKDYCIDFSKDIGHGGEGSIFLCQHQFNKGFYVVKTKWDATEDAYKLDKEYVDYKTLGRLHAVLTEEKKEMKGSEKFCNMYVVDLVDGVTCNKYTAILPTSSTTDEQRVFIAYNFLQEIIFLAKKGVYQTDQNPNNVMLDVYGKIQIIDFGDRGRATDKVMQAYDLEKMRIPSAYQSYIQTL